MITSKNYTFYIATTPGKLRKLVVPAYLLHSLAVLAVIGAELGVGGLAKARLLSWHRV